MSSSSSPSAPERRAVNRLHRHAGLEKEQSSCGNVHKNQRGSRIAAKVSRKEASPSKSDEVHDNQWNDTLSLLLSTNTESNDETMWNRAVPIDGLHSFSIEGDEFEEEEDILNEF